MTNTANTDNPVKWLRICIAQSVPSLDSFIDVDPAHLFNRPSLRGAALARLYASRALSTESPLRKSHDWFFWVYTPGDSPCFVFQRRQYDHDNCRIANVEQMCGAIVTRAIEFARPDENGRALVVIDPFECSGRMYAGDERTDYHRDLLKLAATALKIRAPAPAPAPAPEPTPIQAYVAAKTALDAARLALETEAAKVVVSGHNSPVKIDEKYLEHLLGIMKEPDAVFRVVPMRLEALRRMGFEIEVLYTVPAAHVYAVVRDRHEFDEQTHTDSYIRLRVPAYIRLRVPGEAPK